MRPIHRAAALLLCLTVAACTPYGESTRWEEGEVVDTLPAVDWPMGDPDMSNEWVAALYTSVSLLAAAQDAHDFSSPALQEHVETGVLQREVMGLRDWVENGDHAPGDARPYLNVPGPTPVKILEVTQPGEFEMQLLDEDKATIQACRPRGWTTTGRPAEPEDIWNPQSGFVIEYTLQRNHQSGVIQLSSIETRIYEDCDQSGAHPGYFDPAPRYDKIVTAWDFLGTDGVPIPNSDGVLPDCTKLDRSTGQLVTDANGLPVTVC